MDKLELLVSYAPQPVLRAMVRCPSCKKYFDMDDVFTYILENRLEVNSLQKSLQTYNNKFVCPVCGHIIVGNDDFKVVVKETADFPKAMKKVVSWEE